MSQIQIQNLTFTYDGSYEPIFQDLSLTLDTDWRLGLIGRNGRGKTTLLRLLCGELEYRGVIQSSVPCDRFPFPVEDRSVTVVISNAWVWSPTVISMLTSMSMLMW